MPEKFRAGGPADDPSIDPIAFDDQIIFGLDPAVHWVQWNNQQAQFPEIVVEITKHWDQREWLERLLNRLGYTTNLYDPDTHPSGIFERLPAQERSYRHALHIFLLRAAGVKFETIQQMFGGLPTGLWRLAQPVLDNLSARRNALTSLPPRS